MLVSCLYVLLVVVEWIVLEVDELLGVVVCWLLLDCVIGVLVLFGWVNVVFIWLVVLISEFLVLYVEVYWFCGLYLVFVLMVNSLFG